jgi:hypothetical protein
MSSKAFGLPEWLWAPFAAGLLSAIIGALGMWSGLPLLFPSLGPTIFLQVYDPDQESSRPYNVILGHALGILAAVLGLMATGAGMDPSVLGSGELTWPRVWAAVIAMALTLALQVPLKAGHPPASATALLLALGGFSVSWPDMIVLAAGILLTAALGEVLRRLRSSGS